MIGIAETQTFGTKHGPFGEEMTADQRLDALLKEHEQRRKSAEGSQAREGRESGREIGPVATVSPMIGRREHSRTRAAQEETSEVGSQYFSGSATSHGANLARSRSRGSQNSEERLPVRIQ